MGLNGKKVLLIAPEYYSIEKEIKGALEFNGAIVDCFEDKKFSFDWRYSTCKGLRRKIYPFIEKIKNARKLYWKNQQIHFVKYDILLWINGYSFSEYVIDVVRQNNPKIQTNLYLYDDTTFYNFTNMFPFFDKLYSFDLNDSTRYSKKWNLQYKPLYWKKIEKKYPKQYQFSSVGYCNYERLIGFSKLADSGLFRDTNILIKLYLPILSRMNYIKSLFKKVFIKAQREKMALLMGDIKSPYITHVPVSYDENIQILGDSDCVIDIVKETQVGFTNRAMQTVGNGIKLISNNKNLINAPFYDSNMIQIIDLSKINKEEIFSFITNKKTEYENPYLSNQELNRWVLDFGL